MKNESAFKITFRMIQQSTLYFKDKEVPYINRKINHQAIYEKSSFQKKATKNGQIRLAEIKWVIGIDNTTHDGGSNILRGHADQSLNEGPIAADQPLYEGPVVADQSLNEGPVVDDQSLDEGPVADQLSEHDTYSETRV